MLKQDDINSDELTDVELVERFLCGNMDADEEARFMASLNADEHRRAKAVAMAYLVKAMKAEGSRRDRQLMQAMCSVDRSDVAQVVARAVCGPVPGNTAATAVEPAQKPAIAVAGACAPAPGGHNNKIRKLLYGFFTTLSVAAAIVIVFWGYRSHIDSCRNARLADEYATAFAMEPAPTRGSGDEAMARKMSRLFARVRRERRSQDLQAELSHLWELSQQPTYNDYTPYSSLIGWNLAIVCLRNDDKARACEVLTVLASHADSDAVRAKAAELLAKLE